MGDRGQSTCLNPGDLDDAIRQFDKKFKDKSGLFWRDRFNDAKAKKYTFLERNYEPDSSEDEEEILPDADSGESPKEPVKIADSKLPQQVQDLMSLIFDLSLFASVMADMNYDAKKLPLGKLSQRTLERGYNELKKLAAVIADPATATTDYNMGASQAIENFSNMYYSYIPHAFGRNRPPIINSEQMLKREVDMLESLSDMRIAEELMKDVKKDPDAELVHPADRQFNGLGMNEMTPLDHDSIEFQELEQYLSKTHGSTHYNINYEVESIFRIERNGEHDRFDQSQFSKVKSGDRRLLWYVPML